MAVAASRARHGAEAQASHREGRGPYLRLAAMTALSFLAMYALMYAMVDRMGNVLPNLNQAYMAGLMTAFMVIIELALMRSMYPSGRRNAAIALASVGALAACWLLIREQSGIGDEQFLRSMIPHHAGAILMCQEASLRDPEIEQLCRSILSSQQREIDLMKAKLESRQGR